MSKTDELLIQRRKEILDEIQRATPTLHAELRVIDIALAASKESREKFSPPPAERHRPQKKQSMEAQIIEILDRNSSGLRVAEIAEMLRAEYERDVKKNQDVSWYLSKLKKENKASLGDDGAWKPVYDFI